MSPESMIFVLNGMVKCRCLKLQQVLLLWQLLAKIPNHTLYILESELNFNNRKWLVFLFSCHFLLHWSHSEEIKKLLLWGNIPKIMLNSLAFCESVKASTLMPDKNHTSADLEGVALVHERAVAFWGAFWGGLWSLLHSDNTVIGCYEIALWDLSLPSCSGRWVDFFQFTLMFCSLPLVELSRISTKSCCLAAGDDLLTENAISLISLLQDFLDGCNGPIIQIIPTIRLLKDLLPPWSAFVNLSPTSTENQKKWYLLKYFTCMGKTWNVYNILLIPSQCDWLVKHGFLFDVLINEKIRFLQIWKMWKKLN